MEGRAAEEHGAQSGKNGQKGRNDRRRSLTQIPEILNDDGPG